MLNTEEQRKSKFIYGLNHPYLLRSGATREEKAKPLPRDELIPHPLLKATRAETIRTTTDQVWPWLMQIGHGRGGWYGWFPAFGWVNGTTKIVPELQSLKVGDVLGGGLKFKLDMQATVEYASCTLNP
jgi:hypothetical protein